MRSLTVTLAVVSLLLLVGCSQEPLLTSGTVISKSYQPEKKWVQIIRFPRYTQVGKTRMLSYMYVPVFHRRPEHWILVIRGEVNFKDERQQKQRTLYVPRETYNNISVGETYSVQTMDKTELPIDQHRASSQEQLAYGVKSTESP